MHHYSFIMQINKNENPWTTWNQICFWIITNYHFLRLDQGKTDIYITKRRLLRLVHAFSWILREVAVIVSWWLIQSTSSRLWYSQYGRIHQCYLMKKGVYQYVLVENNWKNQNTIAIWLLDWPSKCSVSW